ncbi:MAG TPA: TetR family transcriptional regulator [Micrococcaceae bacterium]|nr:TetR family transcriptional regulator [Micrococcaceae bacterium]
MTNLRQAQKQMTRQLLLENGLECMMENGYATTSVDRIARAAGTTRATFYLHFSSKAELVRSLVEHANKVFVSADRPPLDEVVASNDREIIRTWIARKFYQWAQLKAHLVVIHQAASVEPEIQAMLDGWFDTAIGQMQSGLDRTARFEADSRRIRSSLAFGQLEFFSMRWIRLGWVVSEQVALETMADSWCQLLCDHAES